MSTDDLDPPDWWDEDTPPAQGSYGGESDIDLRAWIDARDQRAAPPPPPSVPRPPPVSVRFDAQAWLAKLTATVRVRDTAPAVPTTERQRALDGLPAWLARIGCPLDLRETPLKAELVPAELRRWSEKFPHAKCHALLTGPPSRGKSGAALWLLRELYTRSIASDRWPPTARWIHCGDLYQLVFQKRYDVLHQLRTTHTLVIDDLGAVYEHDWPLMAMDLLIDQRHQGRRPCIVTSNLAPTRAQAVAVRQPESMSIEGRYPRAFARLTDARGPGIVRMQGNDLRSGKPPLTLVP